MGEDKGFPAGVVSGWYSQQAPHGRFQSVHVGEGLFHHVSGSGSAEEVARGDTGLYHTPAQLMYSKGPL